MAAPQVEGEKRQVRRRRKKKAQRRPLRRVLRYGLLIVLALLALPVLLSLLYRISWVHPVSTLMVKDLVTLQGYTRQWTSIEDVAPVAVHSVIMSEDGRFCSHSGVDWEALNTVIEDALQGEKARGASTISMQTVKNLYLWQGRSFVRKAMEVPLALYFDAVVPKKRLMEIYLNIAEWGPDLYGIEAAAQHHFGRSAANLTARQAALLAVTLPNPAERNPARPGPGLSRLAGLIERRAAKAGGYVGCVR